MIINNVKLVLEDEVINGSLEVQDGRNFGLCRKPEPTGGGHRWRGRLAAAGLIELHTDNLDKFFTPRPKVDWPPTRR